MYNRCDNIGKKPGARKGKQRLAWDATVCTHASEAAGVSAWEAEIMGMIKEEGTSQNADRKRVTKESDYKSTETS